MKPVSFEDAVDLFARRPDKEWSLPDCISFVIMRQYGLLDALTADHHFDKQDSGSCCDRGALPWSRQDG